jgi:hypothetical protein
VKEEAMERSGMTSIDQYGDLPLSPVVRDILRHLCESDHPSYGSIVEWCETRGDCCQAVVCPHCGAQYLLDDEEMSELRIVAARTAEALSCGVVFD